jgi:serine/threonine protein kinase
MASSTIIPTRLRHALRLIHCLQKERGASSSLYASQVSQVNSSMHGNGSSTNGSGKSMSGIGATLEENNIAGTGVSTDFLESTVISAREGTDAAFVVFLSALYSSGNSTPTAEYCPSRPWEASLSRVRACVDGAANNNATIHTRTTSGDVGGVFQSSAIHGNGNGNESNPNDMTAPGSNKVIASEIVGSHRVVVMFNILIGNIIDEAVMQVVKREQRILDKEDNDSKLRSSKSKMSMSASMYNMNMDDTLDDEIKNHHGFSPTQRRKEPPSSVFARSLPIYGDSPPPVVNMSASNDVAIHKYRNPPSKILLNDDDVIICGNAHKHEQFSMCTSTPNRNHVNAGGQGSSLQHFKDGISQEYEYKIPIQSGNARSSTLIIDCEGDRRKIKLRNLMSLLLSFVRLKESMGLERAILSNLMATDVDKTHDSSSRLITGLVVEEANQRTIIRDLQNQSKRAMATKNGIGDGMASLLMLMEEMLRPGKGMTQLQEMIRTNFNLEELRKAMHFKKFWEVITIYIDKLHSLEMLLVEELQTAWIQLSLTKSMGNLDSTKKIPSHTSLVSLYTNLNNDPHDWEKQNLYDVLLPKHQDENGSTNLTDEEALRAISKIPGDKIKRLLLSHLKDDCSLLTPNTASSVPKDNLANIPSLQIPHMLQEWEIDLYEIEFRKRIGRGVGGTTYLAKWSGQDVAVKVAAITDLGVEGWHTEVNSLQRLHHPNVIRLLGSIYNPSPQTYGLVLEYCESGDLSAALQRSTPANFFWRVADDVANGMSYLHRKNILHRDIKPGNVLLNGDVAGGNFTAKLSDFGVAIMHNSAVGEEHTAETGTYRWMAPEIIRHEAYSFMADVYSYALVVWQLVTHEIPFKPFTQIEAAGKVAVDCARPPFSHRTPELIIALIETCWKECPDERLSFPQISIELKEIHKVLTEHEKVWLSVPNGHPVYDIPQKTIQSDRNSQSIIETDNKKDSKKNRNMHRSKSPNTSEKRGGLFSIFNPNKNR